MPLDGTEAQLAAYDRVIAEAPLRAAVTRMCGLAGQHINAALRCDMHGDTWGYALQMHGADQCLAEAQRYQREIDAMTHCTATCDPRAAGSAQPGPAASGTPLTTKGRRCGRPAGLTLRPASRGDFQGPT